MALTIALAGCGPSPADPGSPPVIGADALRDGIVGAEYGESLAAWGGDGNFTWSILSGDLPAGLSLATDGTIAGRPTAPGYFPLSLRVESMGMAATSENRIRVYPTEVLRDALRLLPDLIASSLEGNRELLANNTTLRSELEAKITLLSDPDLEAKILNGGLFQESSANSLDGRTIPITIVFPADTMAPGALIELARLGPTVEILEQLLGTPWPQEFVQEMYGFKIGHSGGGGILFMEDRGTYADRGVPQDAIVAHELGHSYIGNEQLTQFLEVYGFNVLETGTTDFDAWSYRRGEYTPFDPENGHLFALLDIYQLIGSEAMGRALATIHSIGARYGEPLSLEARQALVDEAGPDVQEQVAALADKI